MDNFNQIYNSMFKNNEENIQKKIIYSNDIIEKLINHINQLVLFLDQKIKKQFKQYIFLIKSQGYDISNFIIINCIDQVKNKYELILKNLKTYFYVLHSNELQYLKKNIQYKNGFYCGDFNKNITQQAIYISLTPIKFKKKYILQKKKEIQNNKKENTNNIIKYREQNINNVFLQYINYFRNKN